MDGDTNIYDLGDVDKLKLPGDLERMEAPELPRVAAKPGAPPRRIDFGAPPEIHADPDWTAVPSLVLPGAAHMLRGEFAKALCLITLTGFTLTLAWAVYGTLDRLGPTLEVLGAPAAAAVWTLGFLALVLVVLHLSGVYGGARPNYRSNMTPAVHPAVAGTASAIIPGLGQLLNGDRGRAVFLLSGLWLVAASWVLVTPWMAGILTSQSLVLPGWLAIATSPVFRWTLPAVLWTMAIYDAATRAGRGR
jgi:TM2 domain-containing membrane protein YozV